MMIMLRIVAVLGFGATAFCALAWLVTRDRVWFGRALLALKISVGLAFVFFAGVFIERLQAG